MTILVLGATGLLGHAVLRSLSRYPAADVRGVVRRAAARDLFPRHIQTRVMVAGNLGEPQALIDLFDAASPELVVNCVAVGRPTPADPMLSIQVYSVLPQRLSRLCAERGARLIQLSSDGVFSGTRSGYTESDWPDATDVYGVAKQLGEVSGDHAINIRTSIIGHELQSGSGLLEWFLAQEGECRAFTRAIFSGLPTIVLADIVRDIIIPRPDLHGVYHLASDPISKFDLLRLVADRYGKTIHLIADDRAAPNRALNADRFAAATGYVTPAWPALIEAMHADRFDLTRT